MSGSRSTPAGGGWVPGRLQPPIPQRPRFLLDVHLGRLARLLRLLGCDADYANHRDDPELVALARQQDRVLLTRDRGLLSRRAVTHGYLVRADDPVAQLEEVVDRFELCATLRPFTRCLECNGELEDVAKAEVLHRLEPGTRREQHRFRRCRGCDRIYWRGTHHRRLTAIVDRIVERCRRQGPTGPPPTAEPADAPGPAGGGASGG